MKIFRLQYTINVQRREEHLNLQVASLCSFASLCGDWEQQPAHRRRSDTTLLLGSQRHSGNASRGCLGARDAAAAGGFGVACGADAAEKSHASFPIAYHPFRDQLVESKHIYIYIYMHTFQRGSSMTSGDQRWITLYKICKSLFLKYFAL